MKKIKYTIAALAAVVVSIVGVQSVQAGTDSKDSKQYVTQNANESFSGWFVAADAGADFAGSSHTQTAADMHSATLADAGLKGGYIWALPWPKFTLRTEADLSWNGDSRFRTTNGSFGDNSLVTLFDATVGYFVTPKWEPYAGMAVGATTSWVSTGAGRDNSSSLTWGPVAGVRYHMNSHWQLFTEYKYLYGDDQSYHLNTAAASFNTHGEGDNVVTAGVAYLF